MRIIAKTTNNLKEKGSSLTLLHFIMIAHKTGSMENSVESFNYLIHDRKKLIFLLSLPSRLIHCYSCFTTTDNVIM